MNGLFIFMFDEIVKMIFKNSVDLKCVGFGKIIKGIVVFFICLEIIFSDG